MANFTDADDALLEELGVEVEIKATGGRTSREERIIAGFEDIQRFVAQHGHVPQHGEEKAIFERIYAMRLDRLRVLTEFRHLIDPLDSQNLLAGEGTRQATEPAELDDDSLLAALGEGDASTGVSELRHVRSAAEKRAAEEIANSKRCENFDDYKPVFERVAQDLKIGLRQAQPITATNRSVETGDVFILDGLTAYVAEVGAPLKTTAGEIDSRLRVIYSNGTESNLLLRSLQRAFYNDPGARRVSSPKSGQLGLGDTWEPDDIESGTIYVLRSLSNHPYVSQHRELIHKIGVTGGNVETRIANAELEATYLLSKVEVVATYKLAGVNRTKLENLFHRLFGAARLDITIEDRFGNPVKPREWFLVPVFVIDEAVDRIKDGTITDYYYDSSRAALAKI